MSDEPSKIDITAEMIAERRGGTGKMPADMPEWMATTITSIDKFSKKIGNIVCWILMPLIFAMTYEVIMRKFFLAPTIWAYDISRFLYGALFMLGAGYALSKGVHIRADFLYRNFKTKNQGLIDFWLYILFSRINSFSLYDNWLCGRVNTKRREGNGYDLDAIYVAYKVMFIDRNNISFNSRRLRITKKLLGL